MSSHKTLIIENARIVTPTGIRDKASLIVEGGRIAGVGAAPSGKGCSRLDATGGWLMPGFIDLHSDAL
jgi:imidazolonepropionase-like amidohydrolase